MALALGPASAAAGYRLAAFDTVGSTNAEGLALARAGDPGKLWVASLHQTAGRGRRGRPWFAKPGNLAASLLLVTPVGAETAASLSFVAGLALADAIVALEAQRGVERAGDGRITVKWPNDVMADGAKLSGILLEAERLADGQTALVVGIGVNVTHVPPDLPYKAASLSALGLDVDGETVLAALTDAWHALAEVWDEGRGFPEIRRRWLVRGAGIGGPVAVKLGDEVISGTFETIDETGRLMVRAADGALRAVAAGDVHFGEAATAGR